MMTLKSYWFQQRYVHEEDGNKSMELLWQERAVELRQARTDAGAEHEAQLQERAHVGHERRPLLER